MILLNLINIIINLRNRLFLEQLKNKKNTSNKTENP